LSLLPLPLPCAAASNGNNIDSTTGISHQARLPVIEPPKGPAEAGHYLSKVLIPCASGSTSGQKKGLQRSLQPFLSNFLAPPCGASA
jgi:hypothetical protein